MGVLASCVMAFGMLAGAEWVVRAWAAGDTSGRARSVVTLIHGYEQQLAESSPPVWAIGNSTLANGLDAAVFEELTGRRVIKLAHGSATLGASVTMLGHYLEMLPVDQPKPGLLLVFVSKDDLNPNGTRAVASGRYRDFAGSSPLEPSRWMMLRYDRAAVQEAAVQALDSAYSAVRGQQAADRVTRHGDRSHEMFDGVLPNGAAKEAGLLTDWEIDLAAFDALKELSAQHGIERVAVVLLPVTEALVAYHDQHLAELPWAEVRGEVAAICGARGLACLDLGAVSDRNGLFFDACHTNRWGQAVVSRLVGEYVQDGLPSVEPLTGAAFAAWADRLHGGEPAQLKPRRVVRAE